MPLFEFRCEKCQNEFEELLFRRDEESGVSCPSCGSERVEKLVSSFATKGQSEGPARMGKSCSSRGSFS